MNMPLPDANKKSPRVYTNLQNLDLDSVTFANIQATGNPIAVEEMNEDEMRRLVLVNLARLVTAGEWTGLLTAGGGGQTMATYDAAYPQSAISGMGYNSMANPVLSSTPTMQSTTVIYGRPFYASTTGDFDAAQLYVNSAGTSCSVEVKIYSATDAGAPNAVLCAATIDLNSTGTRDGDFSGTTDSVAGTLYWVTWLFTLSARATINGCFSADTGTLFNAISSTQNVIAKTATTFPDPWDGTEAGIVHLPNIGWTYS